MDVCGSCARHNSKRFAQSAGPDSVSLLNVAVGIAFFFEHGCMVFLKSGALSGGWNRTNIAQPHLLDAVLLPWGNC